MIRFEDIHVAYPSADGEVQALRGISLELHDGEMLVVLGANGSGKSTLAKLSDGLLQPDSGVVTVDDVLTSDESRMFEVRSNVGLVFQNPDDQIVATSVAEEVAFGPENLGLAREELRERVGWALEAVGLTGLEKREPHTLSGGQKQRLAIAGALAMRPRHLVLDEPTSMLDPEGRDDVLRILREMKTQGVAVLLVTQRVEDALDADRVAILEAGALAWTGTFAELVSEPARLDAWGLSAPASVVLAAALRDRGVGVAAGVASPDDLVSALCP